MDTWLTPTRDEAATGRFCAGKSIARFGFYSPRRETAGFHVLVFLNEGFRVNVAGTRKSPDRFFTRATQRQPQQGWSRHSTLIHHRRTTQRCRLCSCGEAPDRGSPRSKSLSSLGLSLPNCANLHIKLAPLAPDSAEGLRALPTGARTGDRHAPEGRNRSRARLRESA
jgi:hypothetical protein